MYYTLALALVLRLILINQSLWLDEAIQALALMGKQGPLSEYILKDFQPPLYHYLMLVITRIFGFSEFSLRALSLAAGLLTVYFVYHLSNLLFGKKTGNIAALLVAVNPLLIYYSAEGRTYALTTCLASASFYYFAKLRSGDSSKSSLIWYFTCTTALVWTSYLAWIIPVLQLGYAHIKEIKRVRIAALFALATLIFWIPSFIRSLMIGMSTAAHSPEWGQVVGGATAKSLLLTYVKFVLGRISLPDPWYLLIVLLIAALHFGIIRKKRAHNSITLLWLFGTIIPLWIASLMIPFYAYQRVLFAAPAYILWLTSGFASASRLARTLVIIGFVLPYLYFVANPSFHKENWRQLVIDHPNATFAMPSTNQAAPLIYYGVEKDNIIEPKNGVSSDQTKIVYINYVEDLFDIKGEGREKLGAAGYTVTSSKVYSGISIDIYENHN